MTEGEFYKAKGIMDDITSLKIWRDRFSRCDCISINLRDGAIALRDRDDGNCFKYVKEILDEGIAKKIGELERKFEEL